MGDPAIWKAVAMADTFDKIQKLPDPTDGVPNLEEGETIPQAQRLRSSGCIVYTVGITDQINQEMLKSMSSPPQVLALVER